MVKRSADTTMGPAPCNAKRAKMAAAPTASCAPIKTKYALTELLEPLLFTDSLFGTRGHCECISL